jgi:DNA-binding transcriptional ArsR family regulator
MSAAEESAASHSWAHDLEALAALCAVLAVPLRLRIVMLLTGGERNVTELCEHLRVPQPTVSHHLRILLQGGVVGNRRASRQIYYRLRDPPRGGAAPPAGAGASLDAAGYRVRFALGRKTPRDT